MVCSLFLSINPAEIVKANDSTEKLTSKWMIQLELSWSEMGK